jgi:hypothetical protein
VALNIASRRHRDMHAREIVMRIFGIARMVLNLGPNFVGQVAQLVIIRAAGTGSTSAFGNRFIVQDRQFHDLTSQIGYEMLKHRTYQSSIST